MFNTTGNADDPGLFEALADTLPALVRICDVTGNSIWFNKEWLNFRGRSEELERGTGWLDGLHPVDREANLETLSNHFSEQKAYEIKYRLRHYSGQYRWVLHRAAPRFDKQGQFLGYVTACVDLHDATVANYENAQFFGIASDILITSNQNGYIEKASRACEQVLGWTNAELSDIPILDLIHPDDVETSLAAARPLNRGEELIDFENRYRHKDGSYRWLSWRARKDLDSGTVYASAVDITERKLFESELRETIDRYNLAISATSDGIWDWDIETDALYLSPRNIEMLGFQSAAHAPSTATEWRQHLHPDDLAKAKQDIDAYVNGTSSEYITEFRIQHSDGTWRTILSRGTALRNPNGKAYRMTGVHADITAQRQLEDNLRHLKDQAEAANRAKTDFLANMSHEIRTPMNAVIGAAQLLSMGAPLNEKQQKLVGVLKDSANAMMELLNDFLDLSKIESGNLDFAQTEFDARQVVAEVVQLLEVQAQTKGLIIRQANACACVNERLFIGDPTRIRQLLLNLCSNAVKFTEQGEVSVDIFCTAHGADEFETLTFKISDTGVGIGQDKLALIFDKFEQGDSSITRRFGGTGLGLAIVKALVDAMNGKIDVSSEMGKGSVFTVSLPLRRSMASANSNEAAGYDEQEASAVPIVLLVEDMPANVLIAGHFLEEFGYRYEVATDGQQAVDLIRSGKDYDAILMDVQMPVIDGREATKRIRAFETETNRSPNQIIAMTAHAMLVDRTMCLDAGMDDYLSKPFDPKSLEQKLVRAVATRRKAVDRFLGEVGVPDGNNPKTDSTPSTDFGEDSVNAGT